jgi:hypothetical protein
MQRISGVAVELLASQRLSLMTKTERERYEIKKTGRGRGVFSDRRYTYNEGVGGVREVFCSEGNQAAPTRPSDKSTFFLQNKTLESEESKEDFC